MSTSTVQILVVDDNEMMRDVLSRRLARKGYEVSTANDGTDGLQAIAAKRYDLILLDIMMPGMSGLEVLQKIREEHSAIELPVIMVTAKDQSEDIVEAFKLGANDYLTKTTDFPVVLARIQTQLSLKLAKEALQTSEERYSLAAEGANDGLWDWDLVTDEIYYSTRWKAMLGYAEDEVEPQLNEWFRRIHPEDIDQVKLAITNHLKGKTEQFQHEFRITHRDGHYLWVLARGVACRDNRGKIVRMAGSQTDITQSKVFDALTGLPNRILFMDRLDHAIDRARRDQSVKFAVLFLDLDQFRIINDAFGHKVGDELLTAVARRLELSLRTVDSLQMADGTDIVARLGGDEYMILVHDVESVDDALQVARRIEKELALPFYLSGREIFTTASIGIVMGDGAEATAEDMLRASNTATYDAKLKGRGLHRIFDQHMHAKAAARLHLENDLRQAVEEDPDSFLVYYQPIVHLPSGKLAGFEALVRWQHPYRGLIPPGEFVGVAEETGLIIPIGLVVLEKACRKIKAWHTLELAGGDLTVAVNLSSKQLQNKDLSINVDEIINRTGVNPAHLKLEVTESILMQDVDTAMEKLEHFREMNIKLCIDDFGTGYSSLSYLSQLPLDFLKIDRSFITRNDTPTIENKVMVRTMISLAENLGMDIIAEGIEFKEQQDELRSLGAAYGQGYYYAKPLKEEEAELLMTQNASWE